MGYNLNYKPLPRPRPKDPRNKILEGTLLQPMNSKSSEINAACYISFVAASNSFHICISGPFTPIPMMQCI